MQNFKLKPRIMYALTLGRRKVKLTFHLSLVDICSRCQHVTDYVFHLLPQSGKNRHISAMGEEINKRCGEKLDTIVGNVSS